MVWSWTDGRQIAATQRSRVDGAARGHGRVKSTGRGVASESPHAKGDANGVAGKMSGPEFVGKRLGVAERLDDEGFRNEHGQRSHERSGKLSGLSFHPVRHPIDDDAALRVTAAWRLVLVAALAA